MTTKGERRLSAVMAGAAEALELDRKTIPDPEPGGKRDDVLPGQWTPDGDGMPPDCPVSVLGMDGEILYMIDAMGQLGSVTPSSFGQGKIQQLFADRQHYLYWAWPGHNKEGAIDKWKAEKVRETFYTAAGRKGLWNAVEKVRGRGAWEGREGQLILHSGDYLVIDGKLAHTGEIEGQFYPRRPKITRPWAKPVDDDLNPAPDFYRTLQTWAWRRPAIDPLLLLGWIGAAMIGGALKFRPSVFLIGDKATGKSTLQEIIKAIFGDGMISTPDTTPAGIYQRIGTDSLPVAVDELEAEADNRKVMAVVKLARLSASGGLMLRGGADHAGIEFRARSCFLFSAINPPPLRASDQSRMGILPLDRLQSDEKPHIENIDELGPMLMRRMVDGWHSFNGLFDAYAEALREGGHEGRGQDTYGTLLTCAHLLMGDLGMEEAGYPVEALDAWSDMLKYDPESSNENWRLCLEHLLTSQVDAWRSGMRHTVGALIEAFENNEIDSGLVRQQLAQINLGLLPRNNEKVPGELILAVPTKGQGLGRLFEGTDWSGAGAVGVWTSALRQGPADLVIYDKTVNLVKIGGVGMRCTLVVLSKFLKDVEDET